MKRNRVLDYDTFPHTRIKNLRPVHSWIALAILSLWLVIGLVRAFPEFFAS